MKRSPARALRWEKRAYRHGYSTAALNIGIGYRNEDEPKQSLAWFERALKMGEGAAANFEIGMLLLRTGDVAGAIPHLEEVMKVSPPTFVSEAQWEEAHDILKQLGHGINTHHAKRTERAAFRSCLEAVESRQCPLGDSFVQSCGGRRSFLLPNQPRELLLLWNWSKAKPRLSRVLVSADLPPADR